MAQISKSKKIVGEVLEELFFKYEVGDKLVKHGLMDYLSIRNYQLWREYRSKIPKELEEDNSFYRAKGEARQQVMKAFRIKSIKTFYNAINLMESPV